MANFQLYTKVTVFLFDQNGSGGKLSEEADVSLTLNSGLLPVYTVQSGFAGFTRGAAHLECEVSNAVPVGGIEQGTNLVQAAEINATFMTVILQLDNGQTLTSQGGIVQSDIKHGVNQETKFSFRFQGEPAAFQ